MKGNLACTKMACIQKDSIESGEKETSPTLEKPVLDLLTAVDQGNTRIVKQHINFGTNPNYVFIPPLLPFEGASCLLYTSPSPRDGLLSRMPSSA